MIQLPVKKQLNSLYRTLNPKEERLKFLRLDKNENLVPLPADFLKQLKKELTAEFISAYPETGRLYDDVAKYAGCKPENIYLTQGSDGAIKSVFEAFVEPGDAVVMVSPTYAMFYVYAKMFQAKLHEVMYESDLSLSIGKIKELIQKVRPKLVCIANPNSPTGTVIEPGQLEEIIKLTGKIGGIILMDEAYFHFYNESCVPLIGKYPHLVVTRTFSKALGLASARLGFAAAGEELIRCLHKTRPMYETNAYAVKFAELILRRPDIVRRNVKEALKGKAYLEKQLQKLGVGFFKSYANFVLIDVASAQRAQLIVDFLKENKIIAKAGFKEDPLTRCLRINIGMVSHMKKFLSVFKKALKQYK
jgi:histidinol-phosphate aminotransferase